ncbi:MAG: hypothetical protein HQK98_00705 [Nitrospirae bacterium]|nr:hypothetical protein [Nitrospirota bacterium]
MKKIIIISLCLVVFSALSSNAYSWYTDCNATSPRDTSFSNPGGAFPSAGEQYCGMVLFRVKKEIDKPADVQVLKGNFNEVLKEAPKPTTKDVEVEGK